jgi:uncharacterized protein YodC (DUF2158 family)
MEGKMKEDATNVVKLETKGGGGGGVDVIDIGSIVRLNSGGPEMTVVSIVDYGEEGFGAAYRGVLVTCSWFCDGVMRTETFPPLALTFVG